MNPGRLKFARENKHFERQSIIHDSAIIHPSALVGYDGFGYARDENNELIKIPHAGYVKISSNVEVKAFCTIDRATLLDEFTFINTGTKIDHHCHIAHNVKIGMHNTFANGCVIEGSCQVGDYNTFGTNVVVQRKVIIGDNCTFGSGTIVTKDVPDNSVMVGNPSRPHVSMNKD